METLIALLLDGRPVHTGSAIYTLSITLDGKCKLHVQPDKRIEQALNSPGGFQGEIANADNIGKSSDELANLWDAEHPEDPIEH